MTRKFVETQNNKMTSSLNNEQHLVTPATILADSIASRLKLSRRKCVNETPLQPWWVLRRTNAKSLSKTKAVNKPKTPRVKSNSVKRIPRSSTASTTKRGAITPAAAYKRDGQQKKPWGSQSAKRVVETRPLLPLTDTPITRKRAAAMVLKDVDGPKDSKTFKLMTKPTNNLNGLREMAKEDQLSKFMQQYKIQRTNLLGTGQFGTVYAGFHRSTSRQVAIKLIKKDTSARSKSTVETLRNEANILQTVDHPGIIRFETMCESSDEVFAVMERMDCDMLEMILSQPKGRLSERTAKFLLRQILCALHFLHGRGIVHCDLKPENILLSKKINAEFPQAKICDFGYAKFITGSQLRKSIVGTPAYLAPEGANKTGFNKSLDMWAIGVIIYVSLSGTFPFNEEEDITPKCIEAETLFPAKQWKETSPEAVDLIRELLKIEMGKRMTVDQCIAHNWLQNALTYADLLALEKRLCLVERYLTSDAEDKRWEPELPKTGQQPNNRRSSKRIADGQRLSFY